MGPASLSECLNVILSCEHGGNKVPRRYARLFHKHQSVLRSHAGFDAGALSMARGLARNLAAPLVWSTTTRLLIDLNRSEHHPALFSRFSRALDQTEKRYILQQYYRPYRTKLQATIAQALAQHSTVLHLSVHSFTPILDGRRRATDIGLLYDPARLPELAFCQQLQAYLRQCLPELQVHRNAPYRGTADGATTWLRRCFTPAQYRGVELEINQRWVAKGVVAPVVQRGIKQALAMQLSSC